jgi:hypothetical protein
MFGTSVVSSCQSNFVGQNYDSTHVQHGRVVDIHSLLRIRRTVLVVEIDAGVVDEHIYASVLRDLFREVFDAAAVCDVQFGVHDTASGVPCL